MKLYNYWRSSSSWRVRIALNVKGLAYEYLPVHLVKNEQHSDAYRALNPVGTVPVLEVSEGGQVTRLSQSLAIFEYLEERYPSPALLPGEPLRRARVRMLTELMNSGIQPLHNLAVMQRIKGELGGTTRRGRRIGLAGGSGRCRPLSRRQRGVTAWGTHCRSRTCAWCPNSMPHGVLG